jgi:hypothetical protein
LRPPTFGVLEGVRRANHVIQRYNNQSLAFGITGLVLQVGSVIVGRDSQDDDVQTLRQLAIFLGFALLIWGLALYAKAKGRSPLWGLLGFAHLLGYIALGLLKDLAPEGKPVRPTQAELDEVFGPVGSGKVKRVVATQLVGNSCSRCGERISSGLDADFCTECGSRSIADACNVESTSRGPVRPAGRSSALTNRIVARKS